MQDWTQAVKEAREFYAKLERTQREQAQIEGRQLAGNEDRVRREAARRREKIEALETERTRLEADLEYALLDMLCAMGFLDERWERVKARQAPLQNAIAGLLE